MTAKKRTDPRDELSTLMGSATGEVENVILPGGWAGTDDATSTAPSDQLGNPPMAEEDKPFLAIERDFQESLQLDDEQQSELAKKLDEGMEREELRRSRAQRERLIGMEPKPSA